MNIKELLYEEESTTLDFKEEQYLFVNEENPHKKSELLKDILAFANAWRQSDAYILIGVREVKGSKSEVLGIVEDIDDASLQQFINQKLNRAIHFEYKSTTFDGKKIAYIKIPVQQRPFFIKNDYGKVKKNIVYLRRGSSTDIANPDEVSDMGEAKVKIEKLISNPANYKITAKLIPLSINKELDDILAEHRKISISAHVSFPKILGLASLGMRRKPTELYDKEMKTYKENLTQYLEEFDEDKIKNYINSFESNTYLVKFTIENIGNISDTNINICIINNDGEFIKDKNIHNYRKGFPSVPKEPSRNFDNAISTLSPLHSMLNIHHHNAYRKYQKVNKNDISITLRDMHVGDKVAVIKDDVLFLRLEEDKELIFEVKSKESTSLIRKKVDLIFVEDRKELDDCLAKED